MFNLSHSSVDEPLLMETKKRFVLFPIEHHDIWEAYKAHQSFVWTAEEIDLETDKEQWKRLTDNERHFLKYVLAFFASSDGIVGENLAANFYGEVQVPEARAFYGNQLAIESVHAETYGLLIESFIDDPTERQRLFEALDHIEAVKNKALWAIKWMDPHSASFAERLVAFAVVEGIFFSGSFCSIFWLKNRGLMPGLSFSNELISRDEGLHCDFASLLFSKIKKKPSADRVLQIVYEAVAIERSFVTEAIPVELIGMNSKLMSQYIGFVADRLLVGLGYPKHFNDKNPFDFMNKIAAELKTNFFEKKVSSYAKALVGKQAQDNRFSLDADF